jgi:endonuclease/exonuclease/phosphatase family metal-dependent hydrolase
MTSLRVVQLNVGSLLEPGWAERRHEIVAWLRHLEPDVVCLEEVWEDANNENTAGWIVAQLPELGLHWTFAGDPFGADLWPDPSMRFGSAVLSRWPIDATTYHRLPVVDDGDAFVAAVPWELLHARTAGLDLFVTHLAPAPTHALHRQRQVVAIDRIIRDARPGLDDSPPLGSLRDAMPAILCGDFNAEPDSDEIRFLCSLTALEGRVAFFQDAWRVAGDGDGLTQDWRLNPIAAQLNVHRKRIDYVFVGDPFQRRGSAGRVLRASLAFHEPLTGVLASDHAGLVVEVVWPDRPPVGE